MSALRFLWTLIRRSTREFLDDNCTQMAAAISFYVLFSLFPLLIFLVGVFGFVLQDRDLQEDLIEAIVDFLPLSEDEGRNDVTEAVRGVAGVASGALGVFGLIGMAWSGSNMFGVIRRSLNAAYDLERSRPFVQQKLLDLAMVLGVGAFFLASVAATAFLRTVRQYSDDIPYFGDAAERTGFVWDAGSLLIPLVLSFVAFMVLYWVVPAVRNRPQDVWPGALMAAVLFEIAKAGFALYVANFGRYDLVFGSLGAVAAFLFWLYLSANVLLFGAEVASEYPRVRRGEYERPTEEHKRPLRESVRRALRGLVLDDRERDDEAR